MQEIPSVINIRTEKYQIHDTYIKYLNILSPYVEFKNSSANVKNINEKLKCCKSEVEIKVHKPCKERKRRT